MSTLIEVSGPHAIGAPTRNWIFEQVEDWVKRAPTRVAFIVDHQEDAVEEYTYADVLKFAKGMAVEFAAKGIGRGDRIGILMENVPQWVFAMLGAMRIGAITVPLATTLPETSIELIVQHAGCKLICADQVNWAKASSVAEGLNCAVVNPVASPGLGREAAETIGEGSDTALLIYTSGTTGNPKGVELTFDNLVHEIRGAVESLQLTPDHRILSILPFSHVLPLIANGLGPLCIGACVVFLSSVSPQRIIDAFHRHRITLFVCVPQFFYILHKRIFSEVESQSVFKRFLFGALKKISRRLESQAIRRKLFAKVHKAIGPDLLWLASGGSRFDPAVAEDLSDLGYKVLQAYGLTETSAAATITPADDNRIGTVGKPIRGVKIRIDSPNADGVGEVCISGPIVMKGYYRAPEKTSEAIKEGWF